ncbi:hypothetical protein J2T14_003321 [Paenibacillus harenae]|nr:hypothetical protein [Paenibacillus harenae]
MRFNRKNSYYFWGNVTIRCRNEKIAGEIPVISLGMTKIQILTVEIPFVMWGRVSTCRFGFSMLLVY